MRIWVTSVTMSSKIFLILIKLDFVHLQKCQPHIPLFSFNFILFNKLETDYGTFWDSVIDVGFF